MSKSFTDVELIHKLEPVVETGVGGVYDLRQHLDDVVMPLLRKWRIFERDDLSGEGERRRGDVQKARQGEAQPRSSVRMGEGGLWLRKLRTPRRVLASRDTRSP
jgi:hypothetical protein